MTREKTVEHHVLLNRKSAIVPSKIDSLLLFVKSFLKNTVIFAYIQVSIHHRSSKFLCVFLQGLCLIG